MSLTYVLFTLLDGSAKWLVGSLPVIVVVWLRFVTHVVFASALLLPVRGLALVRTGHLRWHVLRALMFVAMTWMNYWALQYLQLAGVDPCLPARGGGRARSLPARPGASLCSRDRSGALPVPASDLHGDFRLPGVRRRAVRHSLDRRRRRSGERSLSFRPRTRPAINIVSKNKGYFTPSERELPLLRYYANSIAHFF